VNLVSAIIIEQRCSLGRITIDDIPGQKLPLTIAPVSELVAKVTHSATMWVVPKKT